MFQQSKLAEMGLILNMIAHQWRQPLNHVSLIVNTIILKQKKQRLLPEELNSLKNDFQKQITYLSNTIDDFQNFFKPKKDKELFRIKDMVTTTYSLLKPLFDKNQIKLEIDIDSEITYFGYKNELSQVLLNILNNSKDALIENTMSNRLINISLIQSKNNLLIIIEDNAKGIKESILGNIFDPYFSTKNTKNGTGLGLYMSKIIINEHFKGNISANNRNDGLEIVIKIPKQKNKIT